MGKDDAKWTLPLRTKPDGMMTEMSSGLPMPAAAIEDDVGCARDALWTMVCAAERNPRADEDGGVFCLALLCVDLDAPERRRRVSSTQNLRGEGTNAQPESIGVTLCRFVDAPENMAVDRAGDVHVTLDSVEGAEKNGAPIFEYVVILRTWLHLAMTIRGTPIKFAFCVGDLSLGCRDVPDAGALEAVPQYAMGTVVDTLGGMAFRWKDEYLGCRPSPR
ncbi:hypothetical protein BV25DRAFT_1949035 [Artomyces pyxidatus]|uniref:Uncharacterized protein n=1 Tax=Artomyces pyxidatus TaxID=48021 RepID=A0ACB8SYG9_9AGAM|nr:hypothetical protein BV25DRAFT_1949035 [Artomyces pyxidatus]